MNFTIIPGNHLKSLARSFYRNRFYTLLNLFSLGVGFGVFIFATLYVYFEMNFESFHENRHRIYRATYKFTPSADYQAHWARIPFDYINNLPDEVAGIESLVRFQNHARKYVRIGEEKFTPVYAYVADNEALRVFNFSLVSGNSGHALAKPNSVVISASLARQYFGNEDPLGREIFVIGDLDQTETLYHVSGVMTDLPRNTHLPVDILFSFDDESERTGWAYTYIMLEEDADIADVQSAMPEFIGNHSAEDEAANDAIIFQALPEIHLTSNIAREITPNGNMLYVKIVGIAGLLILIMAVINFINLNSAMSLGRAREIGMRKVLGAGKSHLAAYLIGESMLLNLIALVIGAGIVYLTFPYVQVTFDIGFLPDPVLYAAFLLSVTLMCGAVAGIYPVFLLTSLKPVAVLKTSKVITLSGPERIFSMKRVMVTLQFAISILLIASAVLANNQFQYVLNKDLGIAREQVIAIPGVPDQVKARFETFRTRLSGQPGIITVSACMEVPSREIRDAGPVIVEGVNADPTSAPVMDIQVVDHAFTSALGISLEAGKSFEPLHPSRVHPEMSGEFDFPGYLLTQPRSYMINETAMRQLGWKTPDEAIGQRISWAIGDLALAPGPVIGIVKDFHQESLRNKIDPLIMVQEPVWLRTFLIKVETNALNESIEEITHAWNDLFPFYPMEYQFLDDMYENLYKGEQAQVQLLFVFCGIAVLIAFTGLVGLVAYALKTRTKEFAVRKVLGASIGDLVRMVGKEYLIVLAIGGLLAVPLSIYGAREWLAGFAYRIDISPIVYVATLLIVAMMLLVTVGIQTLRAGSASPADTLREE